jgi:hypothetical protein
MPTPDRSTSVRVLPEAQEAHCELVRAGHSRRTVKLVLLDYTFVAFIGVLDPILKRVPF